MTYRVYKSIAVILLSFFHIGGATAQFTIPQKPQKQTSLYDYAKLLTAEQANQLEQKLINYYDSTGTQIVVAIVKTIDGSDIGILTSEWGHEWGVGGKEDNGVFILLAVEEREIYIAPGYGLEHILTAGINGEIIRNDIIPQFKEGDYYAGLDAGTNQLINLFSGTYTKNESEVDDALAGLFVLFLIGLAIFIIIKQIKYNNKNGGGKNGGKPLTWTDKLFAAQTISNAGSSYSGSWSGSKSSSGGFSGGFGGGGFSGGGAGGKW